MDFKGKYHRKREVEEQKEVISREDMEMLRGIDQQIDEIYILLDTKLRPVFNNLFNIQVGDKTQSQRQAQTELLRVARKFPERFDLEFHSLTLQTKLLQAFANEQVDLTNLLNELHNGLAILGTMEQLPREITQSPFKLSVWRGKISHAKIILDKFIKFEVRV